MRLLVILALAASLALPAAASAREEGESSGDASESETTSTDTEQSPQPGDEKPEADTAAPESTEQAKPEGASESPEASAGQADEAAAATAESVPVEGSPQPEPAAAAEDSPDSSALAALRHALDQVAVLQRLLAEGHDGEGPSPGQSELDDIRRVLQDSLVEVARFEQDASLRQWLEGEGLKAALAEVERSVAPEVVATEAESEPEPEVPSAIDAKRLRGVKRAIEDAPFKEGKMAVLTDQLQNVRVRTEQVGELIGLFAFSRDKVEALVFLHPRLVDPERFEDLLSSLKFASDRIAVRQRLGLGGS